MNILFVWNSPFKDGGGVGRVTATLANEFIGKGHRVSYLSFSEGEESKENEISQYFCPDNKETFTGKNLEYIKYLINRHDIEVVINQSGLSDTDVLKSLHNAVSELDKGKSIKIFTVHHNCIKCLYKHFELVVKENYKNHWLYPVVSNRWVLKFLKMRHKRKYQRILNYLIEYSDKLVLLSEKFIPDLQTYNVQPPKEKVAGLPNPAPFEAKNVEHKKENRLVYVGRINYQQKRADLLIELWKRISDTHTFWEFDIVGDGEALEDLKLRAVQKNLKRIHFHGYCDPVPFLERAKFFVMTSAFEGFGMVLVEAQAYGTVPFAFNCFTSLSDILEDNVNGFVLEPFDLDNYAKRLTIMTENEKRRKEMAENARRSVAKFHPTIITGEWEKLFAD